MGTLLADVQTVFYFLCSCLLVSDVATDAQISSCIPQSQKDGEGDDFTDNIYEPAEISNITTPDNTVCPSCP